MFSYKIFRTNSDVLLAVCDADMLGKTFSNGDVQIEVSDFYKGERCGDKKIVELAKGATIINAVGNKITGLLVEKSIVSKSAVMDIGGILHAQVISVGG